MRECTRDTLENGSSHPTFQAHSRSFGANRARDRSANFLLVIHINNNGAAAAISYRLRDKRQFLPIIVFPPHVRVRICLSRNFVTTYVLGPKLG